MRIAQTGTSRICPFSSSSLEGSSPAVACVCSESRLVTGAKMRVRMSERTEVPLTVDDGLSGSWITKRRRSGDTSREVRPSSVGRLSLKESRSATEGTRSDRWRSFHLPRESIINFCRDAFPNRQQSTRIASRGEWSDRDYIVTTICYIIVARKSRFLFE